MADFRSPFLELGQSGTVTVTGSMECYRCYDTVEKGVYNKHDSTLTYVCINGHKNVVDNYNL